MRFVDTHTHLYLPEFKDDNNGRATVERAIGAGVDRLIFPNVDLSTVEPMFALADCFPANIYMAMGLHPTEVRDGWGTMLKKIEALFREDRKYVAVGEIGIDLYWDKTFVEEQMLVFERQVALAKHKNLPVIIHCRDGLEQTLEVLQDFPNVKGVFHSFGGTEKDVDSIRQVGDFYFGINGIVTFKNSKLRETLPAIGIERLLLETDSPYLAPVPKRGKRNESSYIPLIAKSVADGLAIDLEAVANVTTENAEQLFSI